MTACQLIVDPPTPAAWNMAADEWLLQRAADEGTVTLRFYQWAEPTLSLGYFQGFAQREQHAASRDCPLVRRASGGGALLHHHELTYSVAIPAGHQLARRAEDLYDAAHESLVAVLNRSVAGKSAVFSLCDPTTLPDGHTAKAEPFLCFLRRTRGDVLCEQQNHAGRLATTPETIPAGHHKICGSAQRRHRGAVLQHGGILLAQSPYAPELPGVAELTGQTGITASGLREIWIEPLAERLGFDLTAAITWPESAREPIREIENSKFSDSAWLRRR